MLRKNCKPFDLFAKFIPFTMVYTINSHLSTAASLLKKPLSWYPKVLLNII